MNDIFILIISLVVGFVVGIFYFGGLWLTIRQIADSQHPVFLSLGGFIGRTSVSLFIFYLVLKIGNLSGLALSLGGFTLMKFVIVRYLGPNIKG